VHRGEIDGSYGSRGRVCSTLRITVQSNALITKICLSVVLITAILVQVACIYFSFFLVAPTLGSLLPLLEHRAEFPQFLDQGQSVGLLGRVISSSQGLYL
jgi:hypothetical protein